jgi:hypothetical protein
MGRFTFGRLPVLGLACVLVVCSFQVAAEKQASAAFNIASDAFAISNAPGYCFAMAAFSKWYYLGHPGQPPLRRTLSPRAQEEIARQLQEYYSRHMISMQADYCNQYHENQAESFQRFVTALALGEPRIVLLMNKGKRGPVLHAVLAYEWSPEQEVIRVYDPNYSNAERVIDMEQGNYTSLDITYHAICFPEVLDANSGLVKKMESLYRVYVQSPTNIAWARGWQEPAAGPVRGSKPERNPRGPTR